MFQIILFHHCTVLYYNFLDFVVLFTFLGEYPWQAAILKKEQYDNVYVCGGSLIDNSHLLTAAHCITKYR